MTCFIIWIVSVKPPIFAPLSWKQSFYLKKKLIPIENWKMELCEKPHFFCSILKVRKLRYTVFERGDSSLRLLLFCRFHGSYIVSFPTFVLMLSKLSSGRNKSGYQYYSECWLESSEFIHKLTFAIYEKKQKVFQLPSLFVSLCYYISAAVDEKANILVQLAERFRSSLISLFSQYFIVEH